MKMQKQAGSLTFALTLILTSVEGFQLVALSPSRRLQVTPRFEGKDDEIAKLEEQLRKLKEEKDNEIVSTDEEDERENEEIPLDMFMTEQWKEGESNADESSGGFSIVFAVGTVLALLLFSQVPIGQEDLSKYSVGSTPGTEQIDLGDLNRARRSGDL